MSFNFLKRLLPNEPVPTRIRRGPFRGARIVMKPRDSIRKIFGLYEHELNAWLEQALRRTNRVVDVGANDGYFTFGCAAAFQRLNKIGEIIAIENQDQHIVKLRRSIEGQGSTGITYQLVQALAGRDLKPGFVTLDSLGQPGKRTHTLVKIDVEGAEVDVIEGAREWMHPSNCFVIEVHKEEYLERLRKIFAERGHRLVQVNQRPVPLLGREVREETNWWLVSDLSV